MVTQKDFAQRLKSEKPLAQYNKQEQRKFFLNFTYQTQK